MFEISAECSKCGEMFSRRRALTVCMKCGGALLFRYDLERIASKISKRVLEKRKDTFWKFLELLPLSSVKSIVSLGEPYTPLLELSKSCTKTFQNVYAKDDGRLPTGTFKARGMAVAVSALKEYGIKQVAIPSAGNAAAALAAYGARARMEVYTALPKDVPQSILKECVFCGAKVNLVDGLIGDAAQTVARFTKEHGWFDLSTSKQPYRFEGYKAMAFEIAEQFNWSPPDSILFPTGGGEGIIGLWKGFEELTNLGWAHKTPRLILVQSSGCAPLVEAYDKGKFEVEKEWENPETIAAGLRVPKPFASYLTIRALRATKGLAIAVDDKGIMSSMNMLFKEGLYPCPEAAATLAALERLSNEHKLDPKERILLYLTGNATKYFDIMEMRKTGISVISRPPTFRAEDSRKSPK